MKTHLVPFCHLHLTMSILIPVCALLSGTRTAFGEASPPVIVAPVQKQQWSDRLEALGTLRANEAVVLTASIADTITSIHFDDGQRVEKGSVLAKMTGEEETAQVDEMKARLAEARRQFERVKDLPQSGAISESAYDQREREYHAARAMLEVMKSRLRDRLIIAPFSGVLGLRNISVGALVEPGTEIVTLIDDSVMKLDFTVPSVFLQSLQPGLPIVATTAAHPERPFKGQVASIDSQVDPVTRSIMVRARITNEAGLLKPGMLMTITLQYNERDALVVPEESLIPTGSGNEILVVDAEGIVDKRSVHIGTRRKGAVEILSGLNGDEHVITHGTMSARDGQIVSILGVQRENEGIKDVLDRLKTQS